jgi:hypothetical protein
VFGGGFAHEDSFVEKGTIIIQRELDWYHKFNVKWFFFDPDPRLGWRTGSSWVIMEENPGVSWAAGFFKFI